MSEAAIALANVHFSFAAGHPILTDVSFAVRQGELVVLAGPNGSGKSVLCTCLKGLTGIHEGSICIGGEDLTRNAKSRLRAVGLVFQDADTQMVGQTVEKDLAFGLENLGLSPEEQRLRIERIAGQLGITRLLSKRPRMLSGGEKRKVAMAGVLVMEPRILILDEPFANLDYPAVVQVLQAIDLLHQEGHTIMVVTHELEKVLAHATRLLLLDGGRIVGDGVPDDVLEILERHGVRRPRAGSQWLAVKQMSWLN